MNNIKISEQKLAICYVYKYIKDFNMQCLEIDTNIILPARSRRLKGINIFKNSQELFLTLLYKTYIYI